MNDFSPHGDGLLGIQIQEKHSSRLGEEFLIPPFTVLNAREGWWQDRKRAWLALGIKSELGRGYEASTGLNHGGSPLPGTPGREMIDAERKAKADFSRSGAVESVSKGDVKKSFLQRRGYV